MSDDKKQRADQTKPTEALAPDNASDDADAIAAELAALGEDPLDDGEWLAADRFAHSPEASGDDQAISGLSLLRLSSQAASLQPERSEGLLAGVLASAESSKQLATIDESPTDATEIAASNNLAAAVDVLQGGLSALETHDLPDVPLADRGALATVARVRAANAGFDTTTGQRLLDGVFDQATPPAPVIDLGARRRMRYGVVFAAAAAVLLVVLAGLIILLGGVMKIDGPTSPRVTHAVAQVELESAEEHLENVEQRSLETLMTATETPTGSQGDHYLRDLRDARSRATRARAQARFRRL